MDYFKENMSGVEPEIRPVDRHILSTRRTLPCNLLWKPSLIFNTLFSRSIALCISRIKFKAKYALTSYSKSWMSIPFINATTKNKNEKEDQNFFHVFLAYKFTLRYARQVLNQFYFLRLIFKQERLHCHLRIKNRVSWFD